MLPSARLYIRGMDMADYWIAIPLALNFIASGGCISAYACTA